MDKFSIQRRVSSIHEEIEEMLDGFILNPRIQELKHELHDLQEQCEHEYNNGVCVWCGRFED